MQCPLCQTEALVMTERQGIEIDYCPRCRGIWLDRGELDKIIERATSALVPATPKRAAPRPATQPSQETEYVRPRKKKKKDDSDYGKYRYKKRKHWLAELFDALD